MANYQNLKAAISAAIRTNGNQEITGQVLQNVLNSIVSVIGANYTFAGVATPATNPGTPDQNVMYLAMEGGTYTNFNGTVLPAGISLLMWNGSWTSETMMYGDGGVFDISVYKSSGGTLATFADLAAALNGGNNIPVGVRKGGMSVKFVCSSDNNYIQARLMANSFTTDITKWQGVDDEPTADSDNLVKSGNINNYAEEVNANSNDFLHWQYESVSSVIRDAETDRAYSDKHLNFELGFTPIAGACYKINIQTDNIPEKGDLSFTLTNSLEGYTGIVLNRFKVYSTQGNLHHGRTFFVRIPETVNATYITANIRVGSGNVYIVTEKVVYSEILKEINGCKELISGNYEYALSLINIALGGVETSKNIRLEKGYIYEFSGISNGGLNFYYHSPVGLRVMFGKLNHNNGIDSFKFNCEFDIDTIYFTNYSTMLNFNLTVKKKKVKPLNVILDTDFGGDCDDIFAVSHLLLAQKVGKVNILGINASIQRVGNIDGIGGYTVPTAISAMCNYFGFPYVKLGIDKTESSGRGSHYCATCCTYPHPSIPDASSYLSYVDDSVVFYRKLLANLPDGETCNVAIVGAPMGFSRFLDSQADEISSKTGLQLALEKIDTLWWMAGRYPTGYETNFAVYSIADSQNILEKFTNRIIFVGVEWEDVHCGNILYDDNMTYSMLYKAMNEFMVDAFNNGDNPWGYTTLEETWHGKTYAWDPLVVMAMCMNNISFNGYLNYILSDIGIMLTQGTVTLADNGTDTFTANSTGNHYVASKAANHNASWYTHRLDMIIRDRLFK